MYYQSQVGSLLPARDLDFLHAGPPCNTHIKLLYFTAGPILEAKNSLNETL